MPKLNKAEWQALSTRETDTLRDRYVTSLYTTGRLEGLYFGRTSKNKGNPIKFYIQMKLAQRGLKGENGIIDDCYNEAFLNFFSVPSAKIVSIYNESPNKLIATLLNIVNFECFYTDRRCKAHTSCLIDRILYSSLYGDAQEIDHLGFFYDVFDDKIQSMELKDDSHDASEFESKYGFSVDDLLDGLNETQRELFHVMTSHNTEHRVSQVESRERRKLRGVIRLKLQTLNKGF